MSIRGFGKSSGSDWQVCSGGGGQWVCKEAVCLRVGGLGSKKWPRGGGVGKMHPWVWGEWLGFPIPKAALRTYKDIQ